MLFFTADTHFGHYNIIKHCRCRKKAFNSISEMDGLFIDSINKYVKRADTLYHLGDFCWNKQFIQKYRSAINCKNVHLIRGNHDKGNYDSAFSSVQHMLILKKPHIHLCHYPLLSWCGSNYNSIHLYGHCHGHMEKKLDYILPDRKSMDVGIDNIYNLSKEWRPISVDEVLSFV